MVLVTRNLEVISQRVSDTGRDPSTVRIVAVTKGFTSAHVHAAWHAGLRHVGENYATELVAKHTACTELLTWHFLGRLQTNKIATITQHASVLSGVSRVKELDVIARSSSSVAVDLEVNFTDDEQRNGVKLSEIDHLVQRAAELKIPVRGLMTVAPADRTRAQSAFSQLAEAASERGIDECSMGMSDDLELACRAGTTEIRIGRGLFGPR